MAECVSRYGWYPISNLASPPVGSSPFGVDGYKTIAYETWIQLGGQVPDWYVVPAAYGDCVAGIQRGFDDLVRLELADRSPRIVIAEVSGAIGAALRDTPDHVAEISGTAAFSIATMFATEQAVRTVRDNGGLCVTVSEGDLLAAQRSLGREEGLFVEAASATAVASVELLRGSGAIDMDDCVVMLLTSSGLKDPASAARQQDPVLVVSDGADLDSIVADLAYGLS